MRTACFARLRGAEYDPPTTPPHPGLRYACPGLERGRLLKTHPPNPSQRGRGDPIAQKTEAQWTRPIAGAVPCAGPKEMFDRLHYKIGWGIFIGPARGTAPASGCTRQSPHDLSRRGAMDTPNCRGRALRRPKGKVRPLSMRRFVDSLGEAESSITPD